MKKGSEGALPGGQVGFEHVEMIRQEWREKQGLGREGLAQVGQLKKGVGKWERKQMRQGTHSAEAGTYTYTVICSFYTFPSDSYPYAHLTGGKTETL